MELDPIVANLSGPNVEKMLKNLEKGLPGRTHFRWTDAEKDRVSFLHKNGKTIDELAQLFMRSRVAIAFELEKNGLISEKELELIRNESEIVKNFDKKELEKDRQTSGEELELIRDESEIVKDSEYKENCLYIHENYGPCRLLSGGPEKSKIEIFVSTEVIIEEDIISSELQGRYQLDINTRVYVNIKGFWKTGYVGMYYENGDGTFGYTIDFPKRPKVKFSEKEIFCRYRGAHPDPTASLANACMESQFWHDRRKKFAETIFEQIRACRGLVSIISSNVEITPHQVDVACRVLEDSLQRYLLADEVGMGKTIEAGLIIRQLLIEGLSKILVVAPKTLLFQWETELEKKFCVSDFSESEVLVKSINDLENFEIDEFELLVVDEAHNYVKESIPNVLKNLAENTPRVLFLSATPALGDDKVLLNLLRLLDPENYNHLSIEELKTRRKRSQEIGLFLRGIRTNASANLLHERFESLENNFPGDSEVKELGEMAMKSLEVDNREDLAQNINKLRSHIADVYRIHHRLIRNRRKDVPDYFRSRGPEVKEGEDPDYEKIVSVKFIEDSRFENIFEIFEIWLDEISGEGLDQHQTVEKYGRLVINLFESIGTGSGNLQNILNNELMSQKYRDLFADALQSKNFELSRAKQIASFVSECRKELRPNRHQQIKICIFGSNKEDLIDSANSLKELPREFSESVILAWEIDYSSKDISELVKNDPNIHYLFCSKEEEEGLNLEFFDVLFHLDLPFDPSRLEQRIGRLDRFGRRQRLKHWIVLPKLNDPSINLWLAWFKLLADGFIIFNESVADVQLSLESIMGDLKFALISRANVLVDSIPRVREFLTGERKKLDAQHSLDLVFQEEVSARSLFNDLFQFEEEKEDEMFYAIHGWLSNCLKLKIEGDPRKMVRIIWDHNTLLPGKPWGKMWDASMDFNMTNSRNNVYPKYKPNTRLLRMGTTFMQNVYDEFLWDDRGTAFATWRKILPPNSPEQLAFKLCYIIESDPEELDPEGEKDYESMSYLLTRLAVYQQTWTEEIYVDSELNELIDLKLLENFTLQFESRKTRNIDYNLANNQDALFSLLDRNQFQEICFVIRDKSEQWLRKNTKFKNYIKDTFQKGEADIAKRNKRLRQKQINVSAESKSIIDREIRLNNEILNMLDKPRVVLDSIGIIILSSKSPKEYIQEAN